MGKKTIKKTGTLVSQTGKFPSVFVIEDIVDRVRDSFLRSPDKNFGQCVPRGVAHYPVQIWLWPRPEGKEGQLAPTPRRCTAGCLQNRQCVLEECESDNPIPPHTMIPGAGPVGRCVTQLFSILFPRCLQIRIRPSWCCRQMRDSSVKATSFHSAAHILLSEHHW
ncbi:hypothetical protein TNCV_975591 [Trichonephila clavipes]|nr:hypothetical protein TNCV_975591 [Trichonephila clavipes]